MKRKKTRERLDVFIGTDLTVCCKCKHTRFGEPYVAREIIHTQGNKVCSYTCWRCCRDAESTFLIQQKWPLAFDVVIEGNYHRLEWSPGIKAFVEGTGETPKLS